MAHIRWDHIATIFHSMRKGIWKLYRIRQKLLQRHKDIGISETNKWRWGNAIFGKNWPLLLFLHQKDYYTRNVRDICDRFHEK